MKVKNGEAVILIVLFVKHASSRYLYPHTKISNMSYILQHLDSPEETYPREDNSGNPLIVLLNDVEEETEGNEDNKEEFDDVFYVTGDDGILDDILIYDDDAKAAARSELYRNMLRVNTEPEDMEDRVNEEKRQYIQEKLKRTCELRVKCEARCGKKKNCLQKCKLNHDKYDLC